MKTLSVFLSIVYCFPMLAFGQDAQNPIYCYQGECLYCNDTDCMITLMKSDETINAQPTSVAINQKIARANEGLKEKIKELTPKAKKASKNYVAKINKDAQITYETLKKKNYHMKVNRITTEPVRKEMIPVNKQLAEKVKELTPKVKNASQEEVARLNENAQKTYQTLKKNVKELTPKAKDASKEYVARLNENAQTTYQTLKEKNHQMKVKRIASEAKRRKVTFNDYVIAANNSTHKVMQQFHAPKTIAATTTTAPQMITTEAIVAPQTNQTTTFKSSSKKTRVKSLPTKRSESPKHLQLPEIITTPGVIEFTPRIFHYKPTLDFAQYAVHQGNSRTANLVEGFIPLGKYTFDRVLFLDLRYYNPNDTSNEWNTDLGFRQLPLANFMWGIYAGYDYFRSDTRHHYKQINAGIEFWLHRFFIGGNAYIPFGTKVYKNHPLNQAYLIPTDIPYRYNIGFNAGKERILPGGDAEIGFDVTNNLTVYGGGYYFNHSSTEKIAGPKLRATYTFYRSHAARFLALFDRIRLEGIISHDSVRGTTWTAGIRFRFGLPQNSNPSMGVIRHMTDPIRRDLNVISRGYNEGTRLYLIDGRPARVDLVDASGDRSIDAAVSGSPGTPADIIGVRGTRTASGELTMGDRDLTITGGPYSFVFDGHPYTIQIVGKDGNLRSAGSDTTLFSVADTTGNHNLLLEYLTLTSADDTGFAVLTNNDSFGQITVDHVTSDMPFDFTLATSANTSAKITFTNNTLNLGDFQAFDSNTDVDAGVIFYIDDPSQQMTINNFFNNNITISNRTIYNGRDLAVLYAHGIDSSALIFTQGLSNNTFALLDSYPPVSSGFGIYMDSDMTLNNGFSGNTITVLRNQISNVTGCILISNEELIINGDIANNTINVSNNDATVVGLEMDNFLLTINGDIQNNVFKTSWNNNNNSAYGWFISTSVMTLNGNFNNNDFIASNNESNAFGWQIDDGSTATVLGDISYNSFTMSDNRLGAGGLGLIQGQQIVEGSMNHNVVTVTGNGSKGAGWVIADHAIINTFENNEFYIEHNSNNYGLKVEAGADEIIVFNDPIIKNKFWINGSLSGHYGFYLDANLAGTNGNITFEGNTKENLSSSNNQASIQEFGAENIHYNG